MGVGFNFAGVGDGLGVLEKAELGEFVENIGRGAGSSGHDGFGLETFGRENRLASEDGSDFGFDLGDEVDVAGVFEGQSRFDGGDKNDSRGGKFKNFAGFVDFATDFGENNRSNFEGFVDGFAGAGKRLDGDGAILAAGGGGFGDGDSVFHFGGFAGSEGAGGVFEGEPVGDVRVGGFG